MTEIIKNTIKLSHDEACKVFGLPDADTFLDRLDENDATYGYVYSDVYKQAINDGMTEEEAEAHAEQEAYKACDQERDEAFSKYGHAIFLAIEHIAGMHRFDVEKVEDGFILKPQKSIRHCLRAIFQTINGHGPFFFNSVREFVTSYKSDSTLMETIDGHLGWMKRAPAVYGDRSAKDVFERNMRY